MKIIEIAPLDNGGHRNQIGDNLFLPEGWAVIPNDMETENFPFGEVTVQEIDGTMTVTSWIPGVIPEPTPIPEPEVDSEPTTEELLNIILGVNE